MEWSFVDATGFEGGARRTVWCCCHNEPMRYVRKHALTPRAEYQCRADDHVVAHETWPDAGHRIVCGCHRRRIRTDGRRWLCDATNAVIASTTDAAA